MAENNFSRALDCTLNDYGISAKWLAERSGVSQQLISGFRNGKQRVYSDSLERILFALPAEAQQHFMVQLTGYSTSDLIGAIDSLSSADLAQLLVAVADRLRQPAPKVQELLSA
jgi:transcriptional regulator with XRE-family HTH domain